MTSNSQQADFRGRLPARVIAWRFVACTATLTFVWCACAHKQPPRDLTADAYVWQRRWNRPLLAALTESASFVQTWRVLAAEVDTRGQLQAVAVNRQTLRQIAKPTVAVVRIEGRSKALTLGDELARQISNLVQEDWRKNGVPVKGVEIDYDCATDRLPTYRGFLKLLRTRLGRSLTISITALPSWMGSTHLVNLLNEVDEAVLQVHSVMGPKKGLFDRPTALKWAQQWSALSPVPFRLALPTYWSRVTWNEEGRVVAIESEVARYGTGPVGRELVVEPGEVSSLVAEIRRDPPHKLTGLSWFRLPTAEDGRAWTAHTWHAVMRGQALRPSLPLVRTKADQTGATNVYLFNGGHVDARLPAEVSISAHGCESADAIPPYDFEQNTNSVRFRLKGADLLSAGRERLVGWIRCSREGLEGHVSF